MMRAHLTRHPIHPMLVHFPIALWPASLLWDAVGWSQGGAVWWQMSYSCLALGGAMAGFAMIAGFWDYLRLPPEAAAFSTATAHMLTMLMATSAFVGSLVVRAVSGQASPPSLLAVGLSLIGLVFLIAGGWLGGTLVYRYGIGRETS